MATDKKLAALSVASAFGLTDEIYVEQGGTSLRAPAPAELLLSARTYYVRKDGSDSNNGLANTAGGAFLTVQNAINVAQRADTRLYSATIQIADGTYAEDLVVSCHPNYLTLSGNTGTPANVIVQGMYTFRSPVLVSGVTFTGLFNLQQSFVNVSSSRFSSAPISSNGSQVVIGASVTVLGSLAYAMQAANAGIIRIDSAITVSGTPAYSTGFAIANSQGYILFNAQPTGAATGPRYALASRGLINTSGGGASYLPGNSSGTNTDTTGAYL